MKTRFHISYIGLILFSLLFFTSCEKEETKINMPAAKFKFTNSWMYVANGETLKIQELSLDQSQSSPGIRIKNVEYYFDGELISASTSAPFGLSYLIQNKSLGEHELKIKAKVVGDGYSDTDFTLRVKVTVLDKPFVLDLKINFDTEFTYDEQNKREGLHNGETLAGSVEISEETSFDAKITKVEYFWDDKAIGATSFEPFYFSFPIENETIGIHEFKIVATTTSEELNTQFIKTISQGISVMK